MGKTKLTHDPLEEVIHRNTYRKRREQEAEEREMKVNIKAAKLMTIAAIPIIAWRLFFSDPGVEANNRNYYENPPEAAVVVLDERMPVSIDSVIEQAKPKSNVEQKNVKAEEPKKIEQKPVQYISPKTESRYEGIVAKWGPLVKNVHHRFPNVGESLIYGLIEKESSWNPKARGSSGEYGLGQLKASTARALGVNRYNVAENLAGSVKYLNQLIEHYNGGVDLALANYNGGPKAVKNGSPRGYVSGYIDAVKKKQRAFERVLAR